VSTAESFGPVEQVVAKDRIEAGGRLVEEQKLGDEPAEQRLVPSG
jgi:hypothetical protein